MRLRKIAISISMSIMALTAALPVSAAQVDDSAIENTLVDSASLQSLKDAPEVALDIVDTNGKVVENADITVLSISEDHKVIYQGKADEKGHVTFKVSLSDENKAAQVADVATGVFEVYYVNPLDNEMGTQVFSVPFLKENVVVKQKDYKKIKDDRKVNLKLQFKDDKSKKAKKSKETSNYALGRTVSSRASSPGTGPNCVPGGGTGYTICTNASVNSNSEVKIGTINVGSNETGTVQYSTSSSVKLSAGYQTTGASAWSSNGVVDITNQNSTAGTYTVPGKCIYNNGTYCNVSVDFYGFFTYNYTSKTVYYYGVKQWDEYKVTPLKYNGTSGRFDYSTTSYNGYSVINAKQQTGYFEVSTAASTAKTNTSERSYSLSVSVATPIGSYSGSTTTTYAKNTTYSWVSTASGVNYGHYMVNGMYYVTRSN